MKIKSRFTKIAVASGLIVASGAAVLGITGFASAQVAQRSNVVAVAQATETTLPTNSSAGTTAVDPTADAPADAKMDRPLIEQIELSCRPTKVALPTKGAALPDGHDELLSHEQIPYLLLPKALRPL